eukprot:INCI1373.1.p1 GENE.INCI1373.1~~INCI1373.1.p1  ORF type:complete len:322 (-),score=73.64 INCI1373.1:64-1029(-)
MTSQDDQDLALARFVERKQAQGKALTDHEKHLLKMISSKHESIAAGSVDDAHPPLMPPGGTSTTNSNSSQGRGRAPASSSSSSSSSLPAAAAAAASAATAALRQKLQMVKRMFERGSINAQEFRAMKRKLLSENVVAPSVVAAKRKSIADLRALVKRRAHSTEEADHPGKSTEDDADDDDDDDNGDEKDAPRPPSSPPPPKSGRKKGGTVSRELVGDIVRVRRTLNAGPDDSAPVSVEAAVPAVRRVMLRDGNIRIMSKSGGTASSSKPKAQGASVNSQNRTIGADVIVRMRRLGKSASESDTPRRQLTKRNGELVIRARH